MGVCSSRQASSMGEGWWTGSPSRGSYLLVVFKLRLLLATGLISAHLGCLEHRTGAPIPTLGFA